VRIYFAFDISENLKPRFFNRNNNFDVYFDMLERKETYYCENTQSYLFEIHKIELLQD